MKKHTIFKDSLRRLPGSVVLSEGEESYTHNNMSISNETIEEL